MATLRFNAAQARTIIDHAWTAPTHNAPYGQKEKKPGLWLVKDEGIYIMSNGTPALMADGTVKTAALGETQLVAYAVGYDPTKEDRSVVWDKCREAVGGDDFVEQFDLTEDIVNGTKRDSFTWLVIHITAKRMSMALEYQESAALSTDRNRLRVYLAPKVADETHWLWCGIKKGGRKKQLWSAPKKGKYVDTSDYTTAKFVKTSLEGRSRDATLLSGLSLEEALDAYAKAFGITFN